MIARLRVEIANVGCKCYIKFISHLAILTVLLKKNKNGNNDVLAKFTLIYCVIQTKYLVGPSAEETCNDGILNQDEIITDCGGVCLIVPELTHNCSKSQDRTYCLQYT